MNKRKHLERKSLIDEDDQESLLQEKKDIHEDSDIRGDRGNIAILFFLYLLQGVPLGLASAIPMLLQNRGASYKVFTLNTLIRKSHKRRRLIHIVRRRDRRQSFESAHSSSHRCIWLNLLINL